MKMPTLGLLIIAMTFAPIALAEGLHIENPRCEYLVNPLAIEEAHPRLSWTLVADRRAEKPTAYQVLVASGLEALANDQGDLWDSGKVESAATAHIAYAGKALSSRQRCFWKVRAWNRDGEAGPWSAPAKWEMGLINPSDWSAKWIEAAPTVADIRIIEATFATADGKVKRDVTEFVAGIVAKNPDDLVARNELLGGDPAYGHVKRLHVCYTSNGRTLEVDVPENAPANLVAPSIPSLRKSFVAADNIRSARIHSTALGVYELQLNGQRVGDQYLSPGWTDYPKRVRYQTYDVTTQLKGGENVFGATLADGWFCGHAGLFGAFRYYGQRPALLAQLEIEYDDGRVERIVTDASWKTHPSPLLLADLLKGETYDANLESPGWSSAGFDHSAWSNARARDEQRTLQCDIDQPVRVLAELPAKSLAEPAPGRWTFDLGQNMVGVIRLRTSAPRGTVITIRHGEMLNPDGTIYTENLRGATSTDTYICKGGGETWQPQFTFHGFRYVELTGLPAKPELDAVTGIVLGTDLPSTGAFACSDADINQLQSNIVWGMRGNYLSIPTDCPQRDERMGWMADAQVFLPTAAYNADVAAFMSKWMIDITDAQRADGAHADTAPVMRGLNYGTPAWGDAGVIVPWLIHRTYGDRRILERNIDSMIRWVQWCKANSTNLIRDKARGNDYGDWLSIDADTPKDLIGTAYFAHAADIVANALVALDREAEAREHRRLFDDIRNAFASKYIAADGRIAGDTQCGYILALRFDLMPDELRAKAMRHLVEDVKAKRDHLSTGFVGVSHFLPALTANGHSDVAYTLLMQETFPSWLFSVKHGATTIWERWNGWTPESGVHPDASMNSFNHYSLGSCGQWLFESAAGIAQEPDSIGFDRIVIQPQIGGGLTRASATYRSMHGEIASAWTIENGTLTLNVTIPVNTTAKIHLPVPDDRDVLEAGRPLAQSEGVQVLRKNEGLTLQVGSGTYAFAMPRR